ncbi:27206_t:CDS:2 [Dentiscutata erythropus]|uniref:27206_t:CDS:1 n=1 Tax=Dentiscutata erythropus TaxID=1348616 RepID=A0A9N8YXM4_9GLOM|nr:27206_t:CDS:2 [Dentiscutata erythropus]
MLFIEKCLHEYEVDNDYYTSYITLIQASGTGKSKLLMHSAENTITVYCCLRDSNSSGYLSGSHIAKTLLDEFKSCEIKESCKKWIDEYTNNNSQEDFWKDIEQRINVITDDLKKYVTNKSLEERVEDYYFKQKITTGESSVKCLFVFNEAYTLVKQKVGDEILFYYVRRALKHLPKNAEIFAIFMSTYSNISNFLPISYLDLSKRVAEEGAQLFKPFYLLGTVDMNIDIMDLNTEIKLEMSEDLQHFFQYGRPFEAEEFKPECVIVLAMDKLVVPQSRYASQLVMGYMHLYLNILDDYEYVITLMPSEPMLAEASAWIMNNPNICLTELIN